MDDARTLFQLGIDLEHPSTSQAEDGNNNEASHQESPLHATDHSAADRKDYFIEQDGEYFAGTHLIVDLWEAEKLDDLRHVEDTLRAAVDAAGATLLHIHLHHFTPNFGISGVAVLAESHISIHSWPECGYAALDVFMCGGAEPHRAVDVLREGFAAGKVKVTTLKRGEAP